MELKIWIVIFILLNRMPCISQEMPLYDPVGFWQGVADGEVGLIELSSSGHATFIFGKDTLGGPNGEIGGEKAQLQYQLEYDSMPWQIDFKAIRQSDLTEVGVMKGILTLYSKEIMNLCVNFTGDERPKSLSSEECLTLFRIPAPPRKK